MHRFQTIVLGLGAYGSSVAYQLAKLGNDVLGIDQFTPPHRHGSTHGETRITRLAIGEGEQYTPLAMRSHEIWREIEAETGAELLTQNGGLIISNPATTATCHVDGFFDNTLAAARRYRVPHQILNAQEIRTRYPMFQIRDEDRGYFEPSAGFLRPEACVTAQLDLAKRHGAVVHTNEKVTRFAPINGAVEVCTDSARYTANQLVITAGPWLPAMLAPDRARSFTVTRQVLYWFEIRRDPQQFEPANFPIFIMEPRDYHDVVYGFPAIEGLCDGVKIATEQFETTTTPENVSRVVTHAEIEKFYTDCVAPYLPDLGPQCLKTATCLYTSTPDCRFIIDRHPDSDRVLVVSACSGHGFKHSPAIAEAIAQQITTGTSSQNLSAFSV